MRVVVERTLPVDGPADAVWALLRDFGDDSWTGVPITMAGEGVGAVRTVAMPFGPVVERCDGIDDGTRTLAYAVVGGDPGPCTDFEATLAVRPSADPQRSELHWVARYEPTGDPDGMVAVLDALFPAVAEALGRHVRNTGPQPSVDPTRTRATEVDP